MPYDAGLLQIAVADLFHNERIEIDLFYELICRK